MPCISKLILHMTIVFDKMMVMMMVMMMRLNESLCP